MQGNRSFFLCQFRARLGWPLLDLAKFRSGLDNKA
jgi:hypothetical protein